MAQSLLSVKDITKRFSGVTALNQVNLSVHAGEVHGLLGENGAGKSTLLKILSGAQGADSGEIHFAEQRLLPSDTPLNRQNLGIVTIYQEFNLLPALSVAENMYIGREPLRTGLIDWKRLYQDAQAVLSSLGLSINPYELVGHLSVADQQMVEIARAMTLNARLIIMDEPTAALSGREVDTLHRLIADLKGRGISIIYVSHRLDEIKAICDRFSVLRDGRYVATAEVAGTEIGDMVRLMVGRDVEFNRRSSSKPIGPVILSCSGVTRLRGSNEARGVSLRDISLDVHAGEILGLSGLVGAGRSEFARILFGADRMDAGQIVLNGQSVVIDSPQTALKLGIAYVPEDRKQQGCFLNHSVKNNLSLPSLKQLCGPFGFIRANDEGALVDHYQKALQIKMANDGVAIGTLSGGNQQKVLLARYMALKPKVLIVDEPTRGIDIGAKSEVHQVLSTLANEGVAVVVISSELPEVMAISDRIAVFREGRINGIVNNQDIDEADLMALMALDATSDAVICPIDM